MQLFKLFLISLIIFFKTPDVLAQTAFESSEGEAERQLSKYLNASAICSKMTDPEALYNRGMLLLNDKNEEAYIAAADCFTSAAMRNHTPSQMELGKLYERGNGVGQSSIFAYKWYQTAVLLGNEDTIPLRDDLESKMTLDEIAMANPMIQSTLSLLEMFNERKVKEIEDYENDVKTEYMEFGVDISKYDIKEEKTENYENPLIETLIRDQLKKETEEAKVIEAQKPKNKPSLREQLMQRLMDGENPEGEEQQPQ